MCSFRFRVTQICGVYNGKTFSILSVFVSETHDITIFVTLNQLYIHNIKSNFIHNLLQRKQSEEDVLSVFILEDVLSVFILEDVLSVFIL